MAEMQMSTIKIVAAWMLLWSWVAVAYAGTVTYVYSDPQGTPLAEADASGNITARFDYTPYGVAVASMGPAPNGPGYTGHVNDPDTGLVYMQARYYDPAVGRFLSADPVAPAPGNLFNFNRYDYTNNNPINHIDPDGRQVGEVPASIAACAAAPPCAAAVAVGVTAVAVTAKKAGTATAQYFRHVVQESRSKPPPPLTDSDGKPIAGHSIPDGKGGYVTYPDGNANNGKQYRPDGKPHGEIDRPNVKEWKPNPRNPNGGKGPDIVRKPTPDEIPSTGNKPPPPPKPPEDS